MKHSLSIILFMTLSSALYGQEQKSVERLAEDAYAREEYEVAGALYSRMVRSGDKLPADQWMKLARACHETGRLKAAAGYYQHVLAQPDPPAAAYFEYGEVLREQEQYEVAREQYALFRTANADSLQLKAVALTSCDSALSWKAQPVRVHMKPLKELNTSGSELVTGVMQQGLLLMSNGYRTLVLNGGAETHPDIDKRTGQPYYKAYVYRQYNRGNANMFLEELLPGLLGKYRYHIGPVCMNRAEDTLYATINLQGKNIPGDRNGPVNGIRRLQLYQSVKKNGKWEPLVLLPGLNVTGHASSDAVLSSSGNVLYFVSDRPGGFGQTDIWYSEKQADGSWGEPVNCGGEINTAAEESYPTVNEEGILYFSSKGHPGLGGYDIYRAKGSKNSWESAENMKVPFNSGADELGLILKRNGYEGYLSSNRPGSKGGDDIYYFTDPDYLNRYSYSKGSVPGTGDGGRPGVRNGDSGAAPGIPGYGQERPVPEALTAEDEKDIQEVERVRFYYEFNSAALPAESRRMLDLVAAILKRHPGWKLVISAWADSRGTKQYNLDLTALRCYAVIDYLSGKGVGVRRLYYRNRGEQDLVNHCGDGVRCSEAEHRQNRRSRLEVKQ